MIEEEEIIKIVQDNIKNSSISIHKRDLKPKKLIDSLDNQFIFLSLEGKILNHQQVYVGVQNLISNNLLGESGYMEEFMINEITFANDVLKKYTLEER